MFGTCPSTCALNPKPYQSTEVIDQEYFKALLGAVPKRGQAYTYTHFAPKLWAAKWHKHRKSYARTTVMNASCDTHLEVEAALKLGVPAVIALPPDQVSKVFRVNGTRYVQCPATYRDLTCEDCGGGKPLCAREERDYVVVFPAHGASKAKVGQDTQGGCYAAGGNVALHWRRISKQEETETDSQRLSRFVAGLKPRSIVRHHVAGDIGLSIPCLNTPQEPL